MTRAKKLLELVETARGVDQAIREVSRQRNADKVRLAMLLLDMQERGLARALGYASVSGYAEAVIHQSPSTTKQLVALARKLIEMPELAAVAATGELPWTILRTIASAATNETVGEWVGKARELPRGELERQARASRGEEAVERIELEVGREDLEDIRAAVSAVLRERPGLSWGAAIAEICRGVGARRAGEAARPRVVVHVCDECKRGTRETPDGSLDVEAARVEQLACDAEILDVRRGPAPVARAIPPKIANYIESRDKGRCRVPGCRNTLFVENHHELGWRKGHSRRHLFQLCSQHHGARHEGQLVIEGDAEGELTFRLADGSRLGEVRRASTKGVTTAEEVPRGTSMGETNNGVLAGTNTSETMNETNEVPRGTTTGETTNRANEVLRGTTTGETTSVVPRGTTTRETTNEVGLARAALLKLEFGKREVDQKIAVALQRLGPGRSADDLVLAALRATS